MQGILASDLHDMGVFVYEREWNNPEAPKQLAKLAVEAADALIKELG